MARPSCSLAFIRIENDKLASTSTVDGALDIVTSDPGKPKLLHLQPTSCTRGSRLPVSLAMEFNDQFRTELHSLLVWRRDVRRFRRDPLPTGTLERLLHIGSLAPSVGLSQPWRFVVVDSPSRRQMVRASFERCNAMALRGQLHGGEDGRAALYARLKLAGLDDAPCHFAVFADPSTEQGHGLGRRTMPATIDYSAVIAAHTVWLAARAEGIGLGWVSIIDPAEVQAALEVPPAWVLIGYFCMGFPIADDTVPTLERDGWERRADPDACILRR